MQGEQHANDNIDDDEVKANPDTGAGEGGTTPSNQQQQQLQQQQQQHVPAPIDMNGMVPSPPLGLGPGGMGYGYQPPPSSMRPGAGMGGGAFPFPPHNMMPYPHGMGGAFPPMYHPPYGASTAAYANPGMMMMSSAGPLPTKKLENNGTQLQLCTIHPPGMPRAFDVPFPPRKLPVCLRCKKNYRSRELCRQRDEHKALPWQATYVVVTLTEAVLDKREDGSQYIADIPVVASLQEMPDMCRGPADGFMSKQPICKMCKEKNYTREHCRTTSKHTTPPYQTVYIKLVPRSVEDDHLMNLRLSRKKKRKAEANCDGKPTPGLVTVKVEEEEHIEADTNDTTHEVVAVEEEKKEEENNSDNFSQIHPSKTFFAEVSAKKITLKWCEQIQYPDVINDNPTIPMPSSPANNNMMSSSPYHYMNNFMGINSMPHHMQGQMWEAFRAGVMWAQTQGGMMPPIPPHLGPSQMHPMNYGHPDSTKNGERHV